MRVNAYAVPIGYKASSGKFAFARQAALYAYVCAAHVLPHRLIAIITNRYRPEEVEAETQFKKAQIVSYYQTQVGAAPRPTRGARYCQAFPLPARTAPPVKPRLHAIPPTRHCVPAAAVHYACQDV